MGGIFVAQATSLELEAEDSLPYLSKGESTWLAYTGGAKEPQQAKPHYILNIMILFEMNCPEQRKRTRGVELR